MGAPQNKNSKRHVCILNVGLYRSGTTTLAETASKLGLRVYRTFPNLSKDQHKLILQNPEKAALDWASQEEGVLTDLLKCVTEYDIICDGWVALLPFLPPTTLEQFVLQAEESGVHLELVATSRDVEATVKSELQHWTIHNLEYQAGLTNKERSELENSLRKRAALHRSRVECLSGLGLVHLLPLGGGNIHETWPKTLSRASAFGADDWSVAFQETGVRNANPPLPIEGILVTLRLGTGKEADEKIASIERLLGQIEEDSLCRYLVVLGIDADEICSDAASRLIRHLQTRAESKQQMQSFHCVTNRARTQPNEPFPICNAWHSMAVVAWENEADWVGLLGDDIEVSCCYHYRAFYRSFLDISERLEVPFGFGCPFWNDTSFTGFPSFPCVGKTHFEIFGGLIPKHRRSNFINQDLDPYLQHLYVKFNAAPCITEAVLSNAVGGNIGSGKARYERIPAAGWKDFVLKDLNPIRGYLPDGTTENILLDVIVPSYRVQLDYLAKICSLRVPERIYANFIIIIDNKEAMLRSVQQIQTDRKMEDTSLDRVESFLEEYLSQSGNRVRVRCNSANLGASASRNRGLEESAAEFVLHLDDDLVPNPDLLEQYGRKLFEIDHTVVGLVGLVRFPRDPNLPLRHAAVLMSYLTFMFEIAERDLYACPAWGVTANILFRRTSVRFDLAYAKTGGGEDVDYSLRVVEICNGGRLLAVPDAFVVHPFWPGSVFTLSKHFFSWAIGDGALFKRFPQQCYWSFPNLPETLLIALPFCPWIGIWRYLKLMMYSLIADFAVDFSNPADYNHRCDVVQGIGNDRIVAKRSRLFYFAAHILANLYVVVLECGRLRGHIGRLDFFHGIFRRFDWHIGRLPNAPTNFRNKEACKFALFTGILICLVIEPW
jgi:glycosyltransferase involved in cell wall biosynthesis